MNLETRISNLERNTSNPIPSVLNRIELKTTGSTQSLTNLAFTTVGATSTSADQWTTVQNLGTIFTIGATTGKITVSATGRYSIYGKIRTDSNTTGRRLFAINRNATVETIAAIAVPAAANQSPNLTLAVPSFRLTTGDTLELQLYQDSGSARALSASTSTPQYFIVEYLGA